jgi:peptidoglycan biosynthesis protein MviN/MurJ (putative lipid II flippase)
MNKISKICYGLGFVSIALSAYVYGTSGVADATYVGLWVPSFFLVADFFDRHV